MRDDLEHDSGIDLVLARKPQAEAEGGRIVIRRALLKEKVGWVSRPWLHEDNPEIWEGDVSDLREGL